MLSFRHHIDHHHNLPHSWSSSNPHTPSSTVTISTLTTTSPTSSPPYSDSNTFDAPAIASHPLMSSSFSFPGSPAIRVHHSTPAAPYSHDQAFAAHSAGWPYGNYTASSPVPPHDPAPGTRARGHIRATPSSSSAGSDSPFASQQYQSSATHDRLSQHGTAGLYPDHAADQASRMYSNHHLPTPNQTPTQDAFLAASTPSSYPQFASLDSTMATHMAMKQAFASNSNSNGNDDDDAPGFSHSTRHSVSSFGRNSPVTPRTVNGEDFDEGFKLPGSTDLAVRPVHQVPKLERTLTDAYSDELYNPASVPVSTPKKTFPALLSPYHNTMMSERLQQANQARSHSPTANNTDGSRGPSPFRQASPYAHTTTPSSFTSSQGHLNAAARLRQRQKGDAEAAALSRHDMLGMDSEPKTISPKDAVLDYHEADDPCSSSSPLFSEADNAQFGSYAGSFQQPTPAKVDTPFGNLSSAGTGVALNGWANPTGADVMSAYSVATTAAPPQAHFAFTPSSVPGMFHGLPTSTFGTASLVSSSSTDDTPEFPARLTSMESSASEAPPQSSQNSTNAEPVRPASTLADSGTYTCTYHGCTQRFETPQKLQRHKRDAHRQSNSNNNSSSSSGGAAMMAATTTVQTLPPTPGLGSGMTSAALAARNSQAGPHKCERINPTTGKPCNTIFSRPYDLTRHEDTIHNIRKQKVRCALCQEDKTFSRNDALTRHMRVVHPDVDFPGKHRKRGGRGDD